MDRKAGIFFSALIVAIGGIIYEIIIATTASYLIGNGVLHFSLSTGIFLAGMGIGSFLSPYISKNPEQNFVIIELLLGLFGGFSVSFLFAAFAFTELFYLVFVLLTCGIGILIGTEIPLFLAILDDRSGKKMRELTARILSVDYLGSLIASIIFPLILLPQLGLLRTSFLVGLTNLLVGVLILFSFSEITKKYKLALLLFFSAVLLVVGLSQHTKLTTFFNKGLYQDEVIFNKQSEYQTIVVTKFREDLRLYLDGNIQFSSIDEYRYHEALVHIPIAHCVITPKKVLILGGGDGLALREILKYEHIQAVVLVDLDKEVTNLASNFKPIVELNERSMYSHKLEIINQDAFNYLLENADLFDLIIIDLPDPNNEALAKLYSIEFYSLVRRHLSHSGIMVTQATSPYYTNATFWSIDASLKEVFDYTYAYRIQIPSFGEWGFVMAAGEELALDKSFQFPKSNKIIIDTNQIPHYFHFDSDMDRPEKLKISSLFNPQISLLYDEEIRKWQ